MFIRFLDGTIINTENLVRIQVETYGDGSGLRFSLVKGEENLKLSSKKEAMTLLEKIWSSVAANVNCVDISLLLSSNEQKPQLLLENKN